MIITISTVDKKKTQTCLDVCFSMEKRL